MTGCVVNQKILESLKKCIFALDKNLEIEVKF